jgi:hypothetical protein
LNLEAVDFNFSGATGSYGGEVHIRAGRNVFDNSGGGDIVFEAGGGAYTERMRIRGVDGNVGIGISIPAYELDLRSVGNTILNIDAGAGSESWVYYGQGGVFAGAVGMRNGGKMTFYNGGDRMVILNAGNIGMGTTTPDVDAILELSSSTQGFLPPRLTTVQRNSITTPPNGLVIYNTTVNCLEFYRQSYWASLCGNNAYIFTDSYISGSSATVAQITAFDNYRAGLVNGSYNFVSISGSLNSTIVSCSDPVIVNQLASALKNNSNVSLTCGGNTWRVGNCGSGPEISVNTPGICGCTAGIATLRPNSGVAANWGGIGTNCSAASQTLNLLFE